MNEQAIKEILMLVEKPPVKYGELVSNSMDALILQYSKTGGKSIFDKLDEMANNKEEFLYSVVKSLNAQPYSNIEKLLLSTPEVLAFLLVRSETKPGKTKDFFTRNQIYYQNYLKINLPNVVMNFIKEVIAGVAERHGISLTPGRTGLKAMEKLDESKGDVVKGDMVLDGAETGEMDNLAAIAEKLQGFDFFIQDKKLGAAILEYIKEQLREGAVYAHVESFLEDNISGSDKISPRVKDLMVDYILDLDIMVDSIDGFLDQAYTYALKSTRSGDDPIDLFRNKGAESTWDFTVDYFESVEEQGIIPENIRAAGALYFVYQLGDNLGAFKVVDAIVLAWANGTLDLPKGQIAQKLYRYFKLRDERNSSEERGMLYKRIFDIGDTKLIGKAVGNEDFSMLWGAKMEEIALYIDKRSDVSGLEERVSRQPLYQAIRELQHNLSAHMTGMAHLQATELYNQFKECREILEDAELIDQLGTGYKKTMWSVIERVARDEFGMPPGIVDLYRMVAVESDRIFKFVARFDPNHIAEEDFQRYVNSCEIVIKGTHKINQKLKQRTEKRTEEPEFEEEPVEETEEI